MTFCFLNKICKMQFLVLISSLRHVISFLSLFDLDSNTLIGASLTVLLITKSFSINDHKAAISLFSMDLDYSKESKFSSSIYTEKNGWSETSRWVGSLRNALSLMK